MGIPALPQDFITRMRKRLGDEADAFFHALSQPAPVSIRLNPFKTSDFRLQTTDRAFAKDYGLRTTDSVSWCADGFYLDERPAFIYDPLFHAGCYYVQEASSMFAGTIAKKLLNNTTNPIVLDAAAAPGGKSTHLLSALNKKGFLVSNEVIPQRNSVLQENIWKWGTSNNAITQQQLSEFGNFGELFDLILLDAPCSGEGLFRRDPQACNEWSLSSVNGCSTRQRQLIDDVLPSLKTGGYLIYSTCTYAEEENDDNVEAAMKKFPLEKVDIDVPEGVVKTNHGYQFYPHRIKGEGFYISVLRKTSDIGGKTSDIRRQTSDRANDARRILRNERNTSTDYRLRTTDFHVTLSNVTYVVPEHAAQLVNQLSTFNLKSVGTPLYETVNGRVVPHAALALHRGYPNHQAVSINAVQTLNLDESSALQYLYGDSLPNASDITQGYTVAQYRGHGLGWMKAAPNRFNNLYPHPWRIRKRKS